MARLKEVTDQILELDMLYSNQLSADTMKKQLSLQTEFDILLTQQTEYLFSKFGNSDAMNMGKNGRILAHRLQQRTANQAIPAVNGERGLKSTDSNCYSFLNIGCLFSIFYRPSPPGVPEIVLSRCLKGI